MSERDHLGVVTVGAREIYDELVAMREDVRSLSQTHEGVATTLADHEDRIRGLERWRYALPVAAVTSAGTLITAVVKVM
ncbi:hypothetical protein [Streptomyces sp. URMC 124]|uniref:hypothetical protein n=1 Tax=Streptomyces sp. URMC 124 TaxID=3423405 RepID=UPI003F1B3BDA